MGDTIGERSRRPIRADLPADLRALLAEMERLADTSGQSFPKVLDKIFEAGGGRHSPSKVTGWRAGNAFPSEELAECWASVCGGNLTRILALHTAAETAYRQWREQSRAGRSSPNHTPVESGGLARPAPDSPASAGSTPDSSTPVSNAADENSTTGTLSAGASSAAGDATSNGTVTGPPSQPVPAGTGERPWWRTRRAAVAAGVVVVLLGAGAGWQWWPHRTAPADAGTQAAERPCSWWWAGASQEPAAPASGPREPAALMYKVPSGPGSGAIAILPGGSVLQPFQATTNGIDAASAIIGIDGRISHLDQPHNVHLEILQHQDGEPTRLLGAAPAQITTENDNTDITAVFDPPVRVERGQTYALRVVNDSSETIGVYVNTPTGKLRRVPYPVYACIDKEVQPYDPTGKVLSGFISGTTF